MEEGAGMEYPVRSLRPDAPLSPRERAAGERSVLMRPTEHFPARKPQFSLSSLPAAPRTLGRWLLHRGSVRRPARQSESRIAFRLPTPNRLEASWIRRACDACGGYGHGAVVLGQGTRGSVFLVDCGGECVQQPACVVELIFSLLAPRARWDVEVPLR